MFVDREEELERLRELLRPDGRVLLLGLRGYGKTALLRRLKEKLAEEGTPSAVIDCLTVYTGQDLVIQLADELGLREEIPSGDVGAREALDAVFEIAEESRVGMLAFDEVSTLIRRFANFKPYRGAGGPKAVAGHLKSLLDRHSVPVVFCDTSIDSLISLFRDYSSPLFRQFTAQMSLGPLDYDSSMELARMLLRAKGIELEEEALSAMAEYSGGVPQYLRMIVDLVRPGMSREDVEAAIRESLSSGILNTYFRALLEKFSPAEQEVLYVIARGFTRFGEIEDRVVNAAAALNSLVAKGVVAKVRKSRKLVHYVILDGLFALWLATSEFPRLRKLSFERARALHVGFEALVREVFLTLREPVRVRDATGEELEVEPCEEVRRYEGALGEVDMIARGRSGVTYVAEIYAGRACRREKVEELIRGMVVAERLGYGNIIGLLVTLHDPPEDVVKAVLSERERGVRIFILTRRELKEIARKSAVRI